MALRATLHCSLLWRDYAKQIVNSVSRLDDVASGLAQHLAHVAEPVPGPAEQLGGFGDVHRGIVRHPRDREFELADLARLPQLSADFDDFSR